MRAKRYEAYPERVHGVAAADGLQAGVPGRPDHARVRVLVQLHHLDCEHDVGRVRLDHGAHSVRRAGPDAQQDLGTLRRLAAC